MFMHNLFVYKSKNIRCKLTSFKVKIPFKIKTATSNWMNSVVSVSVVKTSYKDVQNSGKYIELPLQAPNICSFYIF